LLTGRACTTEFCLTTTMTPSDLPGWIVAQLPGSCKYQSKKKEELREIGIKSQKDSNKHSWRQRND
jgi:hypothetical protein